MIPWEILLVPYVVIAILALWMTRREQRTYRAHKAALNPLSYLLCVLWPLPVAAILLSPNKA